MISKQEAWAEQDSYHNKKLLSLTRISYLNQKWLLLTKNCYPNRMKSYAQTKEITFKQKLAISSNYKWIRRGLFKGKHTLHSQMLILTGKLFSDPLLFIYLTNLERGRVLYWKISGQARFPLQEGSMEHHLRAESCILPEKFAGATAHRQSTRSVSGHSTFQRHRRITIVITIRTVDADPNLLGLRSGLKLQLL